MIVFEVLAQVVVYLLLFVAAGSVSLCSRGVKDGGSVSDDEPTAWYRLSA